MKVNTRGDKTCPPQLTKEGVRGSQPRWALARELLPDPVGPTVTTLGSGRTGFNR